MTTVEMIKYINTSLKRVSPNGCLSEIGEKFIEERMKKPEDQGGFPDYWKNVSYEDAMKHLTV